MPLTNGGNITAFGSALTENFNGLATSGTSNTWTDNSTISGAYSSRTTYEGNTGSDTTGNLYSYGVAGMNAVTDRALGGLASSGTGIIYYGFKLTNNTGASIGALSISYNGEQWRNSAAAAQTTNFQYQVANAGTITAINTPSTGWTTFSSLSFTSPVTGGSAGLLDGNAAANRTAKSATLTFASPVTNGQEIWLRWQDPDDAGSDHALAIDDLSITALQPTFTITGTAIGNHGNGSPLTSKTITLLKNGTSVGTTTTDGSGVYTFTGLTLASGDKITVYITGAVEKGATVTLAGTSDITGLNIFQKSLIVRSDNGSSISNNDLSNASDGSGDLISVYTVPGGALTTLSGTEIRIWNATTFAPANDIVDGGDWTNNGSFTAGASTVTLNGNLNQTIGGLNNSFFNNLTINNSGTSPNNVVSFGLDTNVGGVLSVNGGVFDQGASFNLVTTGSATNVVNVLSGATWSNLGTGGVTLSRGVSNAGTITFNANGTPCGQADSIVVTSSNSTQRTWSGAGTFSMTDVAVDHQKVPGGGNLPLQIIVNSGTNNGNNTGWTFTNTCNGPYTWIGGANQSWIIATNWSPSRLTPMTNDILIFDGNVTPSPIVTNVPTETDAALRLTNGVNGVTLNASGANTLTLNGGTGTDLDVPSGTLLTLAGANALTISLTGNGQECTVAGQIVLQDGAHQLLGTNAGEITMTGTNAFSTTSTYDASTHPFGAGMNGSVVFQSGATGAFNAGLDPFGGAGHAIVTFNSGSTASFFANSAFSSDGRSYGNLILDGSQTYSGSGANQMTIQNDFTLASGSTFTLSSSSGGDLNLLGNFTDNNANSGALNPNGRTVKFQGGGLTQTVTKANIAESFFDVFIAETAGGEVKLLSPLTITGQLNLSTADSLLELNGKMLTLNGTITGTGNLKGDSGATLNIGGTAGGSLGTLNFVNLSRLLSTMAVNRTGASSSVTLGTNLTIGSSLTLTNGIVNVGTNTLSLNSGATASRTNGYVIGKLQKTFGATGTFTFPAGTANGYSPVDANVTAGTGNLAVAATPGAQPSLDSAHSLQRYWTLTGTGITANLVFHYLAGDVAGTEANYRIIRVSGAAATSFPNACPSAPCVDTTAKTATINGVSAFSDWTLGEPVTPTANNGTVRGQITDANGIPVEGAVIRLSGTQDRKTITDSQGNYNFFDVETNGFYTVTPSRVNYNFAPVTRGFSALGAHTEASFKATADGNHLNPLDTTEYFVRQQYVDFLGREPEEKGFNDWTDTINNCAPNDTSCDRIHVSASFFRSAEFQERGYFVYRFYSTAFGRKPDYGEFRPDLARVSGFLTNDQLEAAKVTFIDDFVNRPAFASQYGSLSNSAFVDALINTAAVNLSNRQALIDSLNTGTITRAQGLRQIAESGEVYAKYYNQAFVVMEYFGYLRRDPDGAYTVWIDVLNANPGDSRHMVDGFMNSIEYRNRFGQ